MLTVHTISDYLNLDPPTQQAIRDAIKCKERLLNWIRQRNNGQSPDQALREWARCPYCTENPGRCKCWQNEQQYGWLHQEERDNSGVHPSGITHCLKAHWYACAGYAGYHERRVDPALELIFAMGTGWHWVMQNLFGLKGAWGNPNDYHPEAPIDPEHQALAKEYAIRGHADAVLENYVVGIAGLGEVSLRLVHEYKTINSNQYGKLAKPKIEHRWQATTYSAVLDIPFVDYLYVNKDNSQLAEFVLPFDKRLWDTEILRKLQAIQSFVQSGQMPPWDHTSAVLNQHECRDCSYLRVCQPQFR